MNTVFGNRIGYVGLETFDVGLVKSLGATVLGKSFVLNIDGLTPNIPVSFENPEQMLKAGIIPCMTISRDDPDFSPARSNRGKLEYRVPAPGAEAIAIGGQIGYTSYLSKKAASACDITYTINVYDRYRDLAQKFYSSVMKPILRDVSISVVDSLGIGRTYSAFYTGSSKLDEVASLTNRVIGWGITVMVQAEVDIWDEEVEGKIIRQVALRGGLMDPAQPGVTPPRLPYVVKANRGVIGGSGSRARIEVLEPIRQDTLVTVPMDYQLSAGLKTSLLVFVDNEYLRPDSAGKLGDYKEEDTSHVSFHMDIPAGTEIDFVII